MSSSHKRYTLQLLSPSCWLGQEGDCLWLYRHLTTSRAGEGEKLEMQETSFAIQETVWQP